MFCKILTVEISDHEIDVCVRLERDEDGKDFVKISAWMPDILGNESAAVIIYYEDQVFFRNINTNNYQCQRFIDDFTEESAREFINGCYE